MTSRTLGIDFGEVRIGLALSDPLGLTAQPLATLDSVGPRKSRNRIAELVAAHEVGRVVVGFPLLLSGEEGDRAIATREWAERLERRLQRVPVTLWDERLTSVQAERTMIAGDVRRGKRRERVDALAAVLILQSYLDAQGAGG